jgi:hypothetical protein
MREARAIPNASYLVRVRRLAFCELPEPSCRGISQATEEGCRCGRASHAPIVGSPLAISVPNKDYTLAPLKPRHVPAMFYFAWSEDQVIRRPLRPHFSFQDQNELLAVMERARTSADRFGASRGYNSPQHKHANELQKTIDALATELTGDPTYYHAKPHGGGFS